MKPLTERELDDFDATATALILRSTSESALLSASSLIEVGFAEITKLLLAEVRRLRTENERLQSRRVELERELARMRDGVSR